MVFWCRNVVCLSILWVFNFVVHYLVVSSVQELPYFIISISKYLIFSCYCKWYFKIWISNCSSLVYRNTDFYILLPHHLLILIALFWSLRIFFLDMIMSSVKKIVSLFPFPSVCLFLFLPACTSWDLHHRLSRSGESGVPALFPVPGERSVLHC